MALGPYKLNVNKSTHASLNLAIQLGKVSRSTSNAFYIGGNNEALNFMTFIIKLHIYIKLP